jgi:hypothetical protein
VSWVVLVNAAAHVLPQLQLRHEPRLGGHVERPGTQAKQHSLRCFNDKKSIYTSTCL